jgi:DNA invertase Pin-like site-specific DNA recombinase
MRAAIYARYSSENQRPESITDQVESCRRFAASRGFPISPEHVFSDEASSGVRSDRSGLAALRAEAEQGGFQVLLVDDLSRLARNTLLMLSILEELRFQGVRVISVADGLDTDDEEATIGIQIRGIFNELQLTDLRKKTLRGQMGQKLRGFVVGEATYGYRSVPVGTIRMDKRGRPRPEGYRMEIDPMEAAVILRIFRDFAEGRSESAIVRTLNAESVAGRRRTRRGWCPSTLHRMLLNTKYVGRWVWNRTQTRRDPGTGRRRKVLKPASEWVVTTNETLRIVPDELWQRVQARLAAVRMCWPGGSKTRGFDLQRGHRVSHYPAELLSGAMRCGSCEGSVVKVSGKSGGYYGCLRASRGACDNRVLVRRTLAESVVVAAVRSRLTNTELVRSILGQVEAELRRTSSGIPEDLRLTEAAFRHEQKRVARLVNFVANGRRSPAIEEGIAEAERRLDELRFEIDTLKRGRDAVFPVPTVGWIESRVERIGKTLDARTEESALLLRRLLSPIRIIPSDTTSGRRHLMAETTLQTLSLFGGEFASGFPSAASTVLAWERRSAESQKLSTFQLAFPLLADAKTVSATP